MNRPNERTDAAERARWLAELAEAVDHAQKLAWSLAVADADTTEVEGLYRRLESVRIEIDALRRGHWATRQANADPIWTSLLN